MSTSQQLAAPIISKLIGLFVKVGKQGPPPVWDIFKGEPTTKDDRIPALRYKKIVFL